MSRRPKVFMVRSTRSPTASAWLTSPVHVRVRRPWARICSAVLSTSRQFAFFSSSGKLDGSRPVPVTTTSAPSVAKASAVARPMPRNLPAPVTSATLPSSEPMSSPWLCARLRVLADVAEFLVADGDALLHALGSRRRAVGPQGLPVRNGEHVVLEGRLRGAPVALDVHGLVHRRLGELQRVGIL